MRPRYLFKIWIFVICKGGGGIIGLKTMENGIGRHYVSNYCPKFCMVGMVDGIGVWRYPESMGV